MSLCMNCALKEAVFRCTKCRVGVYCSQECQIAHWDTHKPECSRLRKAAKKKLKSKKAASASASASASGSGSGSGSASAAPTAVPTAATPSSAPAAAAKPVSVPPPRKSTKPLKDYIAQLRTFKRRYTAVGKAEWWWVFEDTLEVVGQALMEHHVVWLDDFVPGAEALDLRREIQAARETGDLTPGVLGGGKLGSSLAYVHGSVRGDLMKWVDTADGTWPQLLKYGKKVGTVVTELSAAVHELRGIETRSRYMVTCYPSGGARYTRHCDNANGNGRKLTALLYLNVGWKDPDGGKLRVYDTDGLTVRMDVEPLGGRLVLFWSDKRVPHEVMPAFADRYTVTVWFFDKHERMAAEAAAGEKDEDELKRTAKEIREFEAQEGSTAEILNADASAEAALATATTTPS